MYIDTQYVICTRTHKHQHARQRWFLCTRQNFLLEFDHQDFTVVLLTVPIFIMVIFLLLAVPVVQGLSIIYTDKWGRHGFDSFTSPLLVTYLQWDILNAKLLKWLGDQRHSNVCQLMAHTKSISYYYFILNKQYRKIWIRFFAQYCTSTEPLYVRLNR